MSFPSVKYSLALFTSIYYEADIHLTDICVSGTRFKILVHLHNLIQGNFLCGYFRPANNGS